MISLTPTTPPDITKCGAPRYVTIKWAGNDKDENCMSKDKEKCKFAKMLYHRYTYTRVFHGEITGKRRKASNEDMKIKIFIHLLSGAP